MTYEIKLPQFEGPFDLLLFFIERDELDIYDIPIAKITDEFLAYLHQLQKMEIDVASEFILVAATLMRIKARMLLPRKELDEAGNEIDPRQELVDRLIEYKKYKSVIGDLQQMEAVRHTMAPRGNVLPEWQAISDKYATEAELDTLSLYKLMKAFERVLQRLEEQVEVQHEVVQYPYSMEQQRDCLLELVAGGEAVGFERVFEQCRDRIHAIFIFLALLELVQQGELKLKSGMGMNNFWVEKGEETENYLTPPGKV